MHEFQAKVDKARSALSVVKGDGFETLLDILEDRLDKPL